MSELQGLKTAIVEGDVVGGTCVNRGCVPSKALLAVSGRMRDLRNDHHLKSLGIQVKTQNVDRVWINSLIKRLPYMCLIN